MKEKCTCWKPCAPFSYFYSWWILGAQQSFVLHKFPDSLLNCFFHLLDRENTFGSLHPSSTFCSAQCLHCVCLQVCTEGGCYPRMLVAPAWFDHKWNLATARISMESLQFGVSISTLSYFCFWCKPWFCVMLKPENRSFLFLWKWGF